ncbi:D-amino-acid transaminase [Bacillus spongiae]|uniref:D-alanine aminotransferase n=1 Tax=Bacillus spongiae TaxID=2683610 RepID=A0ABU8HID0_9BACI
MEKVLYNGEIVNRSDCSVQLEDRGYQFGDGIYEVIRVYQGKFFTLEEHLDRLFLSAKKLSMDSSLDYTTLLSLLKKLVDVNGVVNGTVYLQWTRGVAKRHHQFPVPSAKGTIIAYTNSLERPISNIQNGVSAKLVEDIRWLRCDIKSLNLLGNVLAKEEAIKADCFEAILHRGEIVTEGSSSNVYMVKEGKLYTHPVSNLILEGITRKVVKRICGEENVSLIERQFTVEDLKSADEVFITSTTAEVMPIINIDNEPVGGGKPGKLTVLLQNRFQDQINQLGALH